MIISPAERTLCVKEYYFSRKNKEIAALSAKRKQEGLEPVISLGIGAPDGCPPAAAVEALCESARRSDSHKYQPYVGTAKLREAFAAWYKRYYNVELNPANEIQPLMGSKEGILLISLTFLNPGDKVLVPDPGYPTYASSTLLSGAQMVPYRLCEEQDWMPDFDELEKMDLSGVKIMWTNYPNMPTGAPASHELYQKIVDFARRHGILVVNDNPYSFILTDEHISIFEVPGSREYCLEMNSLSKAHNMSGWRVGMVAGAAEYITEILKVKSQMDSGMFLGIQEAAVAALSQGQEWFDELNAEYRRRKALVFEMFDMLGIKARRDSCGLFVLGKVEQNHPLACVPEARKNDAEYVAAFDSLTLGEKVSEKLLYDAGVFVTPGFIFGNTTTSFVRASLCANTTAIKAAIERIRKVL